MIDCITSANANRYADALHQVYLRRYDVFVKTRGWKELARDDGIEKDQFDTEAAIYLVSIRPDGFVDGAMRLLPTTVPHLLSEVFPHCVAGEVPRGPDIYEMTRYFTVRDRTQPDRMRFVAGELLCSMFEFCLDRNATWITTMFDTFYLRRMRQNCWDEIILGPPTAYAEGTAVAAKFAVSEKNLAATQRTHRIGGRVLRYVGIDKRQLQNAA
jgi:acyl-homoserine lactone synthase